MHVRHNESAENILNSGESYYAFSSDEIVNLAANLSAHSLQIFVYIKSIDQEFAGLPIDKAKIAKDLNKSPKVVSRCIRELTRKGYLKAGQIQEN
jgi:hypothetical protein